MKSSGIFQARVITSYWFAQAIPSFRKPTHPRQTGMVDNPTLGRLKAEWLLDSGPVSSQNIACVSECVCQGHTCICNKVRLAAAAKWLQSCPTRCNPTDGSPPGPSIPRVPQARTLEWVAISFPNACMHAKSLLCDPMDSSPPLQNTGVGCHSLLNKRRS